MTERPHSVQDSLDEREETKALLDETIALSNGTINRLDRLFGAILGIGVVLIGLLITLIILTG